MKREDVVKKQINMHEIVDRIYDAMRNVEFLNPNMLSFGATSFFYCSFVFRARTKNNILHLLQLEMWSQIDFIRASNKKQR